MMRRMKKHLHKGNTKWCSGCQQWVPLQDFSKSVWSWDLLNNRCRECLNGKRHKKHHYYPSASQFRAPHNEKGEKWCSGCNCWKDVSKFGKNRHGWDGLTARCRECWQKYQAKSFAKPEVRKRRTEYQKRHKRENINARLRNNLSCRIHSALRRQSLVKSEKMAELVGCSVAYFREYLKGLWRPGMTWENHGVYGWHIDHIIPCAAFDLSKPEEQRKCFHYTNLQPMWGKENQSKGRKVA